MFGLGLDQGHYYVFGLGLDPAAAAAHSTAGVDGPAVPAQGHYHVLLCHVPSTELPSSQQVNAHEPGAFVQAGLLSKERRCTR